MKEIVSAFRAKTGGDRSAEASLPVNPVILLPGLGASGLQASLDRVCIKSARELRLTPRRPQHPSGIASSTGIGMKSGSTCILAPAPHLCLDHCLTVRYELLAQPCWLDNMQIVYFPENNTYTNQTGVSIRPNDFGGLNVRDPTTRA